MKKRILDWLEWGAKKLGDVFGLGGGAAGRAAARRVIDQLENDARIWQKIADEYQKEEKMTEMARALLSAQEALEEARRLKTSIGE